MSSVATAGPPPNYPHHNSEGGVLMNGFKQNGEAGNKSVKVYKHIKDLLAARPIINEFAPIRTILSTGEQHAKNADSYFDFRRPDLALEEYLKASIIAIEVIPRHKDYPGLQSDRGELHRMYVGLKKRVSSQQDRFDEAKKAIKENNSQNGTQPATYSLHTDPEKSAQIHSFVKTTDKDKPSDSDSLPKHNGVDSSLSDSRTSLSKQQPASRVGPVLDKKPAIHPKPQALQGKSIKPKSTAPVILEQSTEDLTTRFARLRGSETQTQVGIPPSKPAPVQDPRINTRPIIIPQNPTPTSSASRNASPSHSQSGSLSSRPNRPLGPRDLPSAPSRPLKIALGVQIPQMPRPPEAVYSPARNLDIDSHSEILTQNPHMFNNLITRTPSMDSNNRDLGRGFIKPDDTNPYFYSSPVISQAQTSFKKPDFSSLRSITAQQLQQYMRIGSHSVSILLVDIRNREDFDNGHIMWHSIICIEPITLRADVSADDLEQSLVISPDAEQKLYMKRQNYSLVVYYNQSATSLSKSSGYGKETSLQDFHKAVYDYAFDNKPLQNRPLLLEGGLDAWIDLVGEAGLATSKSSLAVRGHSGGGTNSHTKAVPGTMNWTRTVANVQQQQHKKFGHHDHMANGSEIQRDDSGDDFYFKSADDFLRRFPAVSDIKESMITPSDRLILTSSVPAVPQKAVTPGNPGNQMFHKLNSTATMMELPGQWGTGHMGLHNRGNQCYILAVIQALSSTNEIRDYLIRATWLLHDPSQITNSQAPIALEDQQLGTKAFTNLLLHIWQREVQGSTPKTFINPKSFTATINRLHLLYTGGGRNADLFGGQNQQDSMEFLEFLLRTILQETDAIKHVVQPRTDAFRDHLDTIPLAQARDEVYNSLQPDQRAPIAKLLNHATIDDEVCTNPACNRALHTAATDFSQHTVLYFPDKHPDASDIDINEMLALERRPEELSDRTCKYCKKSGTVRRLGRYWVNFPTILILQINRSRSIWKGPGNANITKVGSRVTFPENNLNLGQCQVPPAPPAVPQEINYDCFAVVCHSGPTQNSGHYITWKRDLVRTGQGWGYTDWWVYNDRDFEQQPLQELPRENVYILFYRRSIA